MDPKPPQAMDDADRWFARLKAPDCTATERMDSQRWRAHPDRAAAYAFTAERWSSIGALHGDTEFDQLVRQALTETESGATEGGADNEHSLLPAAEERPG